MKTIRVRFAPSPTGLMHLGNVRAALINYLFAHQNNGTFIVRIEDTDPERNFDPGARQIIADLHWLDLIFDEGPEKDGGFGPYFQSERNPIYQEHLDRLIALNKVYRCFCSTEELEKKRDRQIALKQPPRYDRTCTHLTPIKIQELIDHNIPFIWRFLVNQEESITITDLARGTITFDLKNYSDFPVSRQDGSFTFMFANCIDDITMRISHVFRGEDHLSNTGNQGALYKALNAELPIFWHLPILCNIEGKKLSKRDFGFSLKDLKDAGYLPEAIINYLAIIGGSFEHEIMDKNELIQALNFDSISTSGQIRYDVQKLNWVNHQWIMRARPEKIISLAQPYLKKAYGNYDSIEEEKINALITAVQGELFNISEIVKHGQFLFEAPSSAQELLNTELSPEIQSALNTCLKKCLVIEDPDAFLEAAKKEIKIAGIPSKVLFMYLRAALTGSLKGPTMHDILNLLGTQERNKRIETLNQSF